MRDVIQFYNKRRGLNWLIDENCNARYREDSKVPFDPGELLLVLFEEARLNLI